MNAAATLVDQAVVADGNIIASRVAKDLPLFGEAVVDSLEATRAGDRRGATHLTESPCM